MVAMVAMDAVDANKRGGTWGKDMGENTESWNH
jgi:hypothetical protein